MRLSFLKYFISVSLCVITSGSFLYELTVDLKKFTAESENVSDIEDEELREKEREGTKRKAQLGGEFITQKGLQLASKFVGINILSSENQSERRSSHIHLYELFCCRRFYS